VDGGIIPAPLPEWAASSPDHNRSGLYETPADIPLAGVFFGRMLPFEGQAIP
jgi:hypothetical protein